MNSLTIIKRLYITGIVINSVIFIALMVFIYWGFLLYRMSVKLPEYIAIQKYETQVEFLIDSILIRLQENDKTLEKDLSGFCIEYRSADFNDKYFARLADKYFHNQYKSSKAARALLP